MTPSDPIRASKTVETDHAESIILNFKNPVLENNVRFYTK